MNTDDLIEQMQLDELADAPLITPVNYAKLYSNITPQLVYYYVRTRKLETVHCNCGRKCINKEAADELFRSTGKLPNPASAELSPISESSDSETDSDDDGQPSDA